MIEINFIGLAISMVLLVAFMTPIIINIRDNNKKKRALENELQMYASENGLVLQEKDSWRKEYVIGLDPTAKKLIYIHSTPHKQVEIIDLKHLLSVNIHAKDHQVGNGKMVSKVVDLLELQLYFQQGSRGPVILQFYNGDLHSDLLDEYPLIHKWHQILSQIAMDDKNVLKPQMITTIN